MIYSTLYLSILLLYILVIIYYCILYYILVFYIYFPNLLKYFYTICIFCTSRKRFFSLSLLLILNILLYLCYYFSYHQFSLLIKPVSYYKDFHCKSFPYTKKRLLLYQRNRSFYTYNSFYLLHSLTLSLYTIRPSTLATPCL